MSTDPASFDERASAYLDNEVSPSERAQVEADPVAMARVREFDSVANAMASPVPPSSTWARERALRAALGAMEPNSRSSDTALPRQSRWRWQTGAGFGLAAAAVAIALLVLVSSDHGNTGSKSASASSMVESARSFGAGSAEDKAAASVPAAPTTVAGLSAASAATEAPATASGSVPELGAFTSLDALSQASQTLVARSSEVCQGHLVATLRWNDQPAQLVERPDSTRAVLSPECVVLALVPRSVGEPAP